MNETDDTDLQLNHLVHDDRWTARPKTSWRVQDALEQRVNERTRRLSAIKTEMIREFSDREHSEIELTLVKDELAADLKNMIRLHELSTRLLASTELQPLLEEVLDATIELLNADFGNIQLFNQQSKALEIVAHRGFKQDFLDHFSNVNEESAACGRAMRQGGRVIIEDVNADPSFAPHRHIAAAAGFRAVQSTPLFSRSDEVLGMISSHFRQPHRPSEHELRFIDLYAHLAAEFIERQRASDALSVSENRFRRYFELGLIGMAITSPAKRFLEVNDELCRILGYKREELLQTSWAELTHPDDLADDVEQFNRLIAGETDGYTLDKRWIRKDCRIIHSIVSAKSVRGADGSVDSVVKLVQDITKRKSAEEKLQRNEMYLAEGQRLSHTASWAWNVSTGEVYWSAELYRIVDVDPDKVKPGYPDILKYVHADDRARVQKTFEDAVREQIEYELPFRVVCSNGTIRHVNSLARPVLNEAGTVIEYVGTTIDITERIQAEEKLRRSEANLTEGQRLSHTGSWAWNVATGECFWSLEHFRIFGLDPETFEPNVENTQRLIHPDDLPLVQQTLDRAIRERKDFEVDYRLIRSDGSIRYHRGLGHPIVKETGELEFTGSVIDITERKHAEEAALKAHQQVEVILESISDNFFGLDKEGRFTYFNQHAAEQMRILGRDPDALIGRVAWEEFPDIPNKEDVMRVLSDRVVIVDESYYAPLEEWVENRMYPSKDGGLVVFQRYITQRKRTEEELRQTQAELAHVTRVSTLGELTASIAHEVNQPLGAIVTNGHACLCLLSRNDPEVKEVREAVECMIADGLRASEVIKRIRRLLKKSKGGKSSYSINNIIREVLALTAGEQNKNGINVRTELTQGLPCVIADRVQIQQVVLNLILNSKEAMSGVGWQPRELLIRSEQAEPGVLVTVTDTGVGIPSENRERAFAPFFTSKEEGLGLGLSISRTIIESHGGRLWSKPNQNGQGTTFQFMLPIGEDH
jgi:PAS domain S-box-containing protein